MKNDNIKSHIFLMLYLLGNGVVTGQLVQFLRVIGTREYGTSELATLLMMLGAWGLSAQRAVHHYNKLYKNNQK